jgi:hypothetical protein
MEATMLQDRLEPCDCPASGHRPLCRVGWAELPTENAERAAIAVAKTNRTTTRAERARQFGSPNPTGRPRHKTQPVSVSVDPGAIAHGHVLARRRELDAARAYASQCEREFDRMPSHDLGYDCEMARDAVAAAELALLAQIDIAQRITDALS